jgi:predicted amidohydrolase YtcJ
MLKKILIGITAIVLICITSIVWIYFAAMPPDSQIYLNGHILTMDEKNSVAEAVAIRDNLIEAVGTTEEINKYIKNNSVVYNLNGKTMIPGIIDAHSHFPGSGLYEMAVNLNSPPIGDVTDIPQVIEAIKKKAQETKKGKWILGIGFDDTLISENRHLTRYDLDQASTEHPIYIMHVSAHIGLANTLALKLAGITSETQNPGGGVIRKDINSGIPIGVLEENAQFPVQSLAMQFSIIEGIEMVKKASKTYAKMGVTTAQCGLANEKLFKLLSFASRFNITPLRLEVWPDLTVGAKMLQNDKFNHEKINTDKFHIGAVKLISDGSIQGYTGYLTKPYHTPFQGDSQYRGYPTIERDELARLVSTYHKAGFQVAIHGNGDAAIDNIIYAIEKAQHAHFREDARPIIIHSQMARDDQLDRMKELGITPSFFVAHTYYWGDRHRNIFLGPQRAERINPLKSSLQKGVPFTIHLDTPVVPMNPMLLVWTATNRMSTSGKVLGKEERISPLQALRAVTIDAAWQIFQEKNRGSIEKGKYADITILSDNPLNNPDQIINITVEKTIVGGKIIHQ